MEYDVWAVKLSCIEYLEMKNNKPKSNSSEELQSYDEFISKQDVAMAYRKAKVNLFYASRSCVKDVYEYESKLVDKLNEFRQDVINETFDNALIGDESWSLIPCGGIKEPELDQAITSSDRHYIWEKIAEEIKSNKSKDSINFRLMENLPVAIHVLSALWINKVGHKFEAKLSDSVYGNRLRRKENDELNLLSLGSIAPYIHPYNKWQNDAIDAMKTAIDAKKSIVVMTTDVKSFYHSLDVRFIKNTDYLNNIIKVELNCHEEKLHNFFVNIIDRWAKKTPIKKGLPVGLAASAVIANMALHEFDLSVKAKAPLYYGRYVDDIIIVMENTTNKSKKQEIADWIMRDIKHIKKDKVKDNIFNYGPPYLGKNKLRLYDNKSTKSKVLSLSGKRGGFIIETIREQIRLGASEWRSLPNLPDDSNQVDSNLVTIIQQSGMPADKFRNIDKVTIKRLSFAIMLRDIEAYARALPPKAWEERRHSFINSFIDNILVLPVFFDFFVYLPRVVNLATSCKDFHSLYKIINELNAIIANLEEVKNVIKIKGAKYEINSERVIEVFKKNITTIVNDSIISAFPENLDSKDIQAWNDCYRKYKNECSNLDLLGRPISYYKKINKLILACDFGFKPLKTFMLPPEVSGIRHKINKQYLVSKNTQEEIFSHVGKVITRGCKLFSDLIKINSANTPTGIIFPTRPVAIYDLYIAHSSPFSDEGSKAISNCLLAFRGYRPEPGKKLPVYRVKDNVKYPIDISCEKKNSVYVAVTSWHSEWGSWIAAISNMPDPDRTKLSRLNLLINGILKCANKPNYVIMPELAIPSYWFLAIAGKLKSSGISFISGVEYIHSRRNKIHNQVWASLVFDSLNFPEIVVYRQDKQRPALHEERDIMNVSGRKFNPKMKPWKSPPIICHGGFQFAILVCSEITNISYLSYLRGRVDAIFVPEWNKDIDTFNSIIESASLNVHAYIIQCNDRKYGDSRIRAPYKNSWKRDIVRVKGGAEDYFILGAINIKSLRAFQSNFRSPKAPYKPVPDGFEISRDRRVLPSDPTKEYGDDNV